MSSVIIVESKNDVMFFKAVCKKMGIFAENQPEFKAFDDNEMEDGKRGLSEETLKIKFQEIFSKIKKTNIQKIGVLLDMDKFDNPTRIKYVNDALKEAFKENFENQIFEKALEDKDYVTQISTFQKIETYPSRFVDFAYYFVNVNGKGELENLLFEMRTMKPSPMLECLDSWRVCTDKDNPKKYTNPKISDKEFLKMQIDFYIRLDTCSKQEQGDRGRKCSMKNLDYILENKTAFDLEHPILDELKTFLKLFA